MSGAEKPLHPGLPRELERLLHDLRGPLNAVFMHLEVLKHAALGAEPAGRRSLEIMERELGRIARMLPAAFDVVALERGAPATVNLRDIAEQAVAEEQARVMLADDPWPKVHGDRPLLVLAVRHLVRNAVEATAAVGAAAPPPRVSHASEGHTVAVVVRDWGTGLRSTSLRSVIKLTSSRTASGVAVGLLIAERVARLHDGHLELAAPPDGGAEVRLTLNRG